MKYPLAGRFVQSMVIAGVSSVIMGGKFGAGLISGLKSAAIGFVMGKVSAEYKSAQTGGKYKSGSDSETSESALTKAEKGQVPDGADWGVSQDSVLAEGLKEIEDLKAKTRTISGKFKVKADQVYFDALVSDVNSNLNGNKILKDGWKGVIDITFEKVTSGQDFEVRGFSVNELADLQAGLILAGKSGTIAGQMKNDRIMKINLAAKSDPNWAGTYSHELLHGFGLHHADPFQAGVCNISACSIMTYASFRRIRPQDFNNLSQSIKNNIATTP